MPTEVEKSVYPLGAPPGTPIPFDVGEPKGLFITSISDTVSAEKTLDDSWELVVLFADIDCIVAFGSAVTLNLTEDATKDDTQLVPHKTPVSIKLPANKFKVIGINANEEGKLYVQNYRRWQALTTEVLNTRI